MTIHLKDFIRDEKGKRRYLVTCDEILPQSHPNPARRGQVCGNRRYLRLGDARRSKMCQSCAQRLKGKAGYKAATEKVQALGYPTLPSSYLDRNPSRPESAFIRALNEAGIIFKTNVPVPFCDRKWLMDIFVEPNMCVEIDGKWVHEKRVEQDREKDEDMQRAGIQFMRVSIDAHKDIDKQIKHVLPKVLKFLKGTSHVQTH